MDDRGHWKAHGQNEALLTSSLVRKYCVPENGELRATPHIGAFHDNCGHQIDNSATVLQQQSCFAASGRSPMSCYRVNQFDFDVVSLSAQLHSHLLIKSHTLSKGGQGISLTLVLDRNHRLDPLPADFLEDSLDVALARSPWDLLGVNLAEFVDVLKMEANDPTLQELQAIDRFQP